MTTQPAGDAHTLTALDDATRRLVRVAAIVAAGSETEVRDALAGAEEHVPHPWIE